MASLQNRRRLFWAIVGLDSLITMVAVVLLLQGVAPMKVIISMAVLFSLTGFALIAVLRAGINQKP